MEGSDNNDMAKHFSSYLSPSNLRGVFFSNGDHLGNITSKSYLILNLNFEIPELFFRQTAKWSRSGKIQERKRTTEGTVFYVYRIFPGVPSKTSKKRFIFPTKIGTFNIVVFGLFRQNGPQFFCCFTVNLKREAKNAFSNYYDDNEDKTDREVGIPRRLGSVDVHFFDVQEGTGQGDGTKLRIKWEEVDVDPAEGCHKLGNIHFHMAGVLDPDVVALLAQHVLCIHTEK